MQMIKSDANEAHPPPYECHNSGPQLRLVQEPDMLIPVHADYLTFHSATEYASSRVSFGRPAHGGTGFCPPVAFNPEKTLGLLYPRPNLKLNECDAVLFRRFKLPEGIYCGKHQERAVWRLIATNFLPHALRNLDIPICQHIKLDMPEVAASVKDGGIIVETWDQTTRLTAKSELPSTFETARAGGDPRVSEIFTTGTGLWEDHQKCSSCDRQGVDTAICFHAIAERLDDTRCLVGIYLDVTVVLGPLHSPKDPAWTLHAFGPVVVGCAIVSWRLWYEEYERQRDAIYDRLGWKYKDGKTCRNPAQLVLRKP